MDLADILVAVFVPVLSFLAARGAQKQSAKATQTTNETALATTTIASRTDMETEAYVRARAMDTETIERQATELKEVRVEVKEIRDRNVELEEKYDDVVEKYDTVVKNYDALIEKYDKALARIDELEKHERESP
jgi:predicted nuclease with TOPRIM domain